MEKVNLFKTGVSVGSYQKFLDKILDMSARRVSSYVCFANVHMLMEGHQKPTFRDIVNNADLVAPDGRPVSIIMRSHYGIKQDRVCGMDIFPDLLRGCESKSLSVFLYGSTQQVLDTIRAKAMKQFPNLTIAGMYSPPFRKLTPEEDEKVVTMINASGANMVFVSLGCPKQETWMNEHKNRISACMLGLGQAFLTYAGLEKRLPEWARKLSLEWTYRLFLEPKRLWKRYLVGNSKFIFLALVEFPFAKRRSKI